MYLQIALKCSDLGHLTSSIEVHKQWVARLEEVSLVQGDGLLLQCLIHCAPFY